MDKFIIPAKKRKKQYKDTPCPVKPCPVKVSAEAYNALVDIVSESTLSFMDVASRAILFASEHVEYNREE